MHVNDYTEITTNKQKKININIYVIFIKNISLTRVYKNTVLCKYYYHNDN